MIIDVHAHPVSRDLVHDAANLRLMDREAKCLAPTRAVDLLLNRMDRGGIARACLMGPSHGQGIALTNQDVRDAVARHPDRLIGFAGVDPIESEPAEVRTTIRAAVREWGFRGVGEFANVDLLDPRCQVVYETCIEVDVPRALVRPGRGRTQLSRVDDHRRAPRGPLGDRDHRTRGATSRHVYVDISALPAVDPKVIRPLIALCLDKGLADRLLFGSDFPLVDPADYARRLRAEGPWRVLNDLAGLPRLSPQKRDMLIGGNAMSLLKLAD